jgi:sulfate adenylyltransferase subunit 2
MIQEQDFQVVLGGARRDEEKARSKERYFSRRGQEGIWNPERQRPELWNHAYLECQPNENWRVFPLNHWTENDIWDYIVEQKLELPSIYFAHERELLLRQGVYYAYGPQELLPNEKTYRKKVRFRTVGDMTCTGAWNSEALTREHIRDELRVTRISERGSRMDDRTSQHAMEERKKEGYF